MRILMTGANGVIGSALAPALIEQGHEVVGLARHAIPITSDEVEWVLWDWTDLESLPTLNLQFDVVVHLASQTDVHLAHTQFVRDAKQNLVGFLNLVEHLVKFGNPHFVLAGTSTDVGLRTGKVDETTPQRPMTFYDVLKVAQQNYLNQFARLGYVTQTTLRLSNVYGATRPSSTLRRGFLDQSIRRALDGDELVAYTGRKVVRDYIHISDVCSAFGLVVNAKTRNQVESFVLGTGKGTSIPDALEMITLKANRASGRHSRVKQAEAPKSLDPIDSRSFVVDSHLFTTSFGWKPVVDLSQGIDLTIAKLMKSPSILG